MHKIVFYKTSSGKEIISDFIDSFSNSVIDKIRSDIRLLKEYGLSLLSTSKVKKISGTHHLYELRVKTIVHIRLFFIYLAPDSFFILHGFIKKTNKTPLKELQIAINRKNEFDI